MFDYIEAEKQESEEQKPKMKMKNCEKTGRCDTSRGVMDRALLTEEKILPEAKSSPKIFGAC